MAWRNVWRNTRRSLVTIAAASLALFVLIHYAGLVTGYIEGMERNLVEREMGDAQIHAAGFRDDPSLYQRIEDPVALLAKLDQAGYAASARLLGGGLAAAGDTSAGVMFRGIDVERDGRVSTIGQHVAEGQWLDPADPKGVVIGRRLARTLNVKQGAEVVVLSQAADGSMANDVFIVRGVLKAVGEGVDRAGMYMIDATFRELMVVPDGAHQVIVRKPATVPLATAAAQLRALTPGLDTKSWRELSPTLASMFDSARGVMIFMFMIVYAAIGILLLNAMLMAVFERIREFGVLKALGAGPGAVFRMIFYETYIQVGIAILVGTALSVPGLWYLTKYGIDTGRMGGMTIHGVAWDPVWRASVSTSTYSGPIVTLIVIVSLAALYPAFKAAWVRPVQAMTHR